ncbi:conserved hypothetical protein [Neospora caninum Liverpool]|uniref:Transmembrane protein n=1 Tax=Neospora caninum (strain Liverpool) TaxID=572307 RepID=F0V7G2_NEOCL|nr:conserved hypothetical protein [Neospora caninum Liverpool]CBZ49653.1 conserved hypothetical protein [Neospora caninum Liverpool]CEL64237.1 TPA: hypothetical protein BN1204_001410 [Neospora caninum Liverpool]|eukprot:XP_003879688.1 conserved hypothetical protein [Neospora caninum Liverpool]
MVLVSSSPDRFLSLSSWVPAASFLQWSVLLLLAFGLSHGSVAGDPSSESPLQTQQSREDSPWHPGRQFHESEATESIFLHPRHSSTSESADDDPDEFRFFVKESGGNLQTGATWSPHRAIHFFDYSSAFRYSRLRLSRAGPSEGRRGRRAQLVFLSAVVVAVLVHYMKERLAAVQGKQPSGSESTVVTALPLAHAESHPTEPFSLSASIRELIVERSASFLRKQGAFLFEPLGIFRDAEAPLLYFFFPASKGSLDNVAKHPKALHVSRAAREMALAVRALRAAGVKSPLSLELSHFEVDLEGHIRLNVLAAVSAAEPAETAKHGIGAALLAALARMWQTIWGAERKEGEQSGGGEALGQQSAEGLSGRSEALGAKNSARGGSDGAERKEAQPAAPSGPAQRLTPKAEARAARTEQADIANLGKAFAELATNVLEPNVLAKQRWATLRGLFSVSVRSGWLSSLFPKRKAGASPAASVRWPSQAQQKEEARRLAALAAKMVREDASARLRLEDVFADALFAADAKSPREKEPLPPAVRVELVPGL